MEAGKWEGNNPWQGLRTYQEGTRLYGRDTEVSTLMDIVCNNLAMVVFGRSGIGKSSLIHAGISPEIRKKGMMPIYIRLEHNTNTSYVQQIEKAVCKELSDEDRLGENVPRMGLWDFFHRNDFYNKEHQQTVPVIIIDQFEEIYTLADAEHKYLAQELFEEFADLLNNIKPSKVMSYEDEATRFKKSEVDMGGNDVLTFRIHSRERLNYTEDSYFHLVICLREDYLYYLERNTSKIPSFKINRFSLHALDRKSAEDVIMLPKPGIFRANEADDIISKIATFNDEGKEEIDPTILSIFLFKYFNSKGNVRTDNIIAEFYADETHNVSRTSLAYLEDNLITGEGFRHIVPYNDALANGVTKQELDQLISSRILTVETRKKHNYIEFSHDVICPIAKEHRERRKIDEQTRKLRKRVLAATGLVFLAIILIGSFLYLNYSLKQSERSLRASVTKNASIRAHYMISQGDVLDAVKLLLNVVTDNRENGGTAVLPETEKALVEAYDSLHSDFACIAVLNHQDDVRTAEFSNDSKFIVTASDDGVCRLWKSESGELVKELRSSAKGMTSASLSGDGNRVAASFSNGQVLIWDIATGKELAKLEGHSASVTYACFSPDGQCVLTSSKDKTVRLWDVKKGICKDTLVEQKNEVKCAVFSSDGSKVITASEDGSSIVYDVGSRVSHEVFNDENASIEYAEFNYDNTKIAIVTNDAVYIKDLASGKTERVIEGHDDLITSATFSPDGNAIATSSHDKTVRLWNIDNGEMVHIYRGHSSTVSDVVFSPDGKFIISTSSDNEARLWNVPIEGDHSVIHPDIGILAMTTYSSNGKYIAAASVMGQVKVLDALTTKTISYFEIDERISSVVFNKEDDKVIVTSENGKQNFFDIKTGKFLYVEGLSTQYDSDVSYGMEAPPEWVLKGHSGDVVCLAPSHDGKFLVSGSADNTAIIWEAESKSVCHELKKHSSQVYYVAFSADDQYVLTASADGTAKLWNVVSGTEVATRDNALSPKYSFAFAPFGQSYIVSDGYDIRIYKCLTPTDLVDYFVTRYDVVQFTNEEKEYYSIK